MTVKLDLALFQPDGSQSIMTAQGGRAVSGAEALAQRFTLVFMNRLGSTAYYAKDGTNFPDEARSANFMTELDVYALFAQAIRQAGAILQAEETDDDPDDERYVGAEITQLTVGEDAVSLDVRITSRAGEPADLTLPLSFG